MLEPAMLLRLRFIMQVALTSVSVSCATVALLTCFYYSCILHVQ